MKLSKALGAYVDEAKKSNVYWAEHAKIDFAVALEQQRKLAGHSYAEIAKGIETSPAYITKVFRGDTNLTIESMVKLARSVNGTLEIRIIPERVQPALWVKNNPPKLTLVSQGTTTQTNEKTEMATTEWALEAA